jgi:activator of HSP90 ATPase
MKTKSIKQTINFKAAPKQVFDMLMNAKIHSAFTSADAEISKSAKGKFSTYDGYCHGYNIELIPGEKILQAWHFAEDGWPEDHFSVCTFLLEPNPTGTKLKFEQTDIPEHKVIALSNGWKEFYWEPMKLYIEQHISIKK